MRDNRFSVVDFDGSNDYISFSDTNLPSGDAPVTIALWFNYNDSEED